jgi:hypothetical protein
MVNKEFITENYCINKDNSQLNCEGKCYLKEQIKQKTESPENPSYLSEICPVLIGVLHDSKANFRIENEKEFESYYYSHYQYQPTSDWEIPPKSILRC